MFARWHFAFILAFQLIMFANCQTRPVNSVCNLQDLCTCDNSLPEKATTLNCDCAKFPLRISNLQVRSKETSFPRSLKTIRISNCDSLTVADNVEMPDNISEFFIKSVKNVIINFLNFRRIANLTFQDVSQLEITQNPFGHTLHADNILFRNVSVKCPMMTPLMTPIVSFLVSKRFEAIDSHFGTNAKIDIVGSVEKRLSVIITNCTTQTFRAIISAHTVEMRRNRFDDDDCDVTDLLERCTNSLVLFTGSLKLAENYYKNMMMPDLVIDGRNITLDLYPDRELKNSTKTTAVAAMQFFTLFNYEGKDDGRVPPDDRVINERGCRTSSSNLKPKYRNSTRQYICDTVADLKKQINSDDFLSDFTNNFAAYLVSNSPVSLPSDNVTEDDTARKSAINICDYPGCACDDSRTVVNCSCLNTLQTGRIKEKEIKISDTSYVFPSTLKSIHLSNCDFIELFTTKGLANLNLEELSISSASGVAIKSGTLKRIANLTIKHVRSFSFEAQAFSQLESSIVHFHNVTFVRDEEVIEFRPSHIKTHLTLSESHLFGNTPIVISQDDVTGLTVNISRCHLEDLIINIKADTVELKNNKFNTTECLIDNSPCDKERSIKFQKSLTVVDNSYKQMSMPDITFDGQNITVNMFPNMMSDHYRPATAEVAKQFLESFHLEIDRNRATGTGQCTPKEVWDSKSPQCKVICNNGNELNSYVTKKLVMQFNKCVQNIPSSRNPRRGSNSATTSLPSHIGVHLLSFLLLVAYPLVSKS